MIATSDPLVGGLPYRTSDERIAACLERLSSEGFCPGADAVMSRTIVWEPSTTRPRGALAGMRAPAGGDSTRQWDRVRGCLHEGRPLFWTAEDAWCWVSAPDRVRVGGTPDPCDPGWLELLSVVLFELMAASGCVAIHGGLAILDGHGTLVVGPSGAGKSTLVHLLSRAGAAYTSDDLTLMFQHDGAWLARSTSAFLRLHSEMTFDDRSTRTDVFDVDGKLRLRPSGAFEPVARVDRIIVLRSGHGAATTWRNLSRQEAAEALIAEAALALCPDVADRQIVSLSALTKLPAVSMRSGEDLLRRPDRAASICRRIWSEPNS